MPKRGILKDEEGDITTEDMESMTGFPKKIFEIAIPILIDEKIGWLEEI